jgi:hypothetical protein
MHAQGRGVAADPVEAYAWYSVADLRYPPEDAREAQQNRADLEALGRRLDAAALARAKERSATIETLTRPAPPAEPAVRPGPGDEST